MGPCRRTSISTKTRPDLPAHCAVNAGVYVVGLGFRVVNRNILVPCLWMCLEDIVILGVGCYDLGLRRCATGFSLVVCCITLMEL